MAIDKTFHHSDPERIVCNNCACLRYDMKRGNVCTRRNEVVRLYWTCELAFR